MSAPALAAGAERAAPARTPRRLPPAWTITALFALAYLLLAPSSPDLAAASYRSDLLARAGFTIWDNSWYGGHHLPAYSLLAPALGALLGLRLLVALSMTIAAALFALLIDGRFAPRATRIAAAWFALGAGIELLSSRVPFDLGLALGLGALLLAQRGRYGTALALTVLCSLASPVAGAFLALALLAWALAGPARAWPLALSLSALAPIALLAFAFPEGGTQPFVASAFYPAFAGVLVIAAVMGPAQRMLRIGALLYAAALLGAYVLPSALGGNVSRLGALFAGPLAACALAGAPAQSRRARALLVLAPFLLYWQVKAPLADFAAAHGDPSVARAYSAPLLAELGALGVGYGARPARIEVVPPATHWEARWIAPQIMIARGWERQLDRARNPLFYGPARRLTAARYEAWLAENSISYVALPDAALDYSAQAEARLLRGGSLGYLREVWRSAHWRLFAVRNPRPLVSAPGTLLALGSDSFTLRAPRRGSYEVRLHFTPYWALASGSGCVARAPGDWTDIRARSAGRLHVVIRFSLARVFSRGARCS